MFAASLQSRNASTHIRCSASFVWSRPAGAAAPSAPLPAPRAPRRRPPPLFGSHGASRGRGGEIGDGGFWAGATGTCRWGGSSQPRARSQARWRARSGRGGAGDTRSSSAVERWPVLSLTRTVRCRTSSGARCAPASAPSGSAPASHRAARSHAAAAPPSTPARSLRTLVIIYKFRIFLVFLSKSYHVRYKHIDIMVRTKYLIDQQDIEISKNRTVTQIAKILGSLAPLARKCTCNNL